MNSSIDLIKTQLESGRACLDEGDAKKALSLGAELLTTDPSLIEAWRLLGEAFLALGEKDQACFAFKTICDLAPDDLENRITVGRLMREMGEVHDSLKWFRAILSDDDTCTDAMTEMHESLLAVSSLPTDEINKIAAECFDYYQTALINDPTRIDLYYSFSHLLIQLGRHDDSIKLLGSVRRFLDQDPVMNYNYAMTLKSAGMLSEALNALGAIDPPKNDFGAKVSHAQALIHLQQQNFSEGWRLWESRWQDVHFIANNPNVMDERLVRWDGSHIKHLLVWAEQGVGDEVMFSSMLEDVAGLVDQLTVACDYRLLPIFKRSFSGAVTFVSTASQITATDFDAQIPMGSLGIYVRPDLKSFLSNNKSWLSANDDVVNKIRSNIGVSENTEIVGLSWFSNSKTHARLVRNLALDKLIKKVGAENRVFVCLQYGKVDDDIRDAFLATGVRLINPNDIDQKNDLENLFNLIAACDQVFSIDNATVHFAGALGVKTTVLLPFMPDWRWPINAASSYWYKSLQTYKQTTPGVWPALDSPQ